MDAFKKFLMGSGACKGPGPNGIYCRHDRVRGDSHHKDAKIYRGITRKRSEREMEDIMEMELVDEMVDIYYGMW